MENIAYPYYFVKSRLGLILRFLWYP